MFILLKSNTFSWRKQAPQEMNTSSNCCISDGSFTLGFPWDACLQRQLASCRLFSKQLDPRALGHRVLQDENYGACLIIPRSWGVSNVTENCSVIKYFLRCWWIWCAVFKQCHFEVGAFTGPVISWTLWRDFIPDFCSVRLVGSFTNTGFSCFLCSL